MIRVLAVDDPAVNGYIDKNQKILAGFPEQVYFDIVPWETYYTTMADAFLGKKEYDVVMIAGHLWKKAFVDSGYIEPLEMEQEDILLVIFEEMYYNDKPYLSPSFCDGHMIVYRKSILRDIFGQLPKEVITPQEYSIMAKELKKHNYQIAMKAHISEIFTDALPFLRMYGGKVYDEKSGDIICDDEKVIAGLEQYCALKKCACDGVNQFCNKEVANQLKRKEVAMGITWSGQMGVVCDETCLDIEDLGFATLTTAWNVTWSFAISARCNQKPWAQKLLKYLRSKEVDQKVGGISGAPVRAESYQKGCKIYPWYSAQLKMITHAKCLPNIAGAAEKNGILYEEIWRAFVGEQTAEESMRAVSKKIKKISAVHI